MNKITVIGVPSSAGARRVGQDRAPYSFRAAGLPKGLAAGGFEVKEFYLDQVTFRPDPEHAREQNLELVLEVAQDVAAHVSEAVVNNTKAIVLGGDCTITLGVVSGLISHFPNLGLIYFDGDADLNTPQTTASGIFDGMVMSHLIGDGSEALAHIGGRYPLMPEEKIVLFGYNQAAGWIDPAEMQRLEQCSMLKYPAPLIRGKAMRAATEALGQLDVLVQHVLIHFDVDVIDRRDFAAADVLHDHGLTFDETMDALKVFASSPKFAGLVITEFNSVRDADGKLAQRLVEAVVKILVEAQSSWK
jgi:arginase